jgi:pimeloyl-ACP methyl ester carboxylesterase
MTGAQDRLTPPSHARRMAGELPRLYRLIELPETGHMGPLERPAEIAEALRELARASESELWRFSSRIRNWNAKVP